MFNSNAVAKLIPSPAKPLCINKGSFAPHAYDEIKNPNSQLRAVANVHDKISLESRKKMFLIANVWIKAVKPPPINMMKSSGTDKKLVPLFEYISELPITTEDKRKETEVPAP